MKKKFITLLLISSIAQAHDTHQTLEQVLAENGVVVENFERVGDEVNLTGEELTKKVEHLERSTLLKSSIGIDPESEEGQSIIENIIVSFDQNELPITDDPQDHRIYPHGTWDPESLTIPHASQIALMRANDSDRKYIGMNNIDMHHEIHNIQLEQARSIAIDYCSRWRGIPIFSGPQNLLGALSGNVQNSDYLLTDGVIYYCISPSISAAP